MKHFITNINKYFNDVKEIFIYEMVQEWRLKIREKENSLVELINHGS